MANCTWGFVGAKTFGKALEMLFYILGVNQVFQLLGAPCNYKWCMYIAWNVPMEVIQRPRACGTLCNQDNLLPFYKDINIHHSLPFISKMKELSLDAISITKLWPLVNKFNVVICATSLDNFVSCHVICTFLFWRGSIYDVFCFPRAPGTT